MLKTKTLSNLIVASPSYNALEYLKLFVFSWELYASDYPLIIVDDGSTDGTKEYLQQLKLPNLHFISFSENCGQPIAHNTCMQLAQENNADYVCILSDDMVFGPGWDSDLEKYMNELDKGQYVTLNLASPQPPGYTAVSFYEAGVHPKKWDMKKWEQFCLDPITKTKLVYAEADDLALPFIIASKYISEYQFDAIYKGGGCLDTDWRFKIFKKKGFKGMAAKENLLFHFGGGSTDKIKQEGKWIETGSVFKAKWNIEIGDASQLLRRDLP